MLLGVLLACAESNALHIGLAKSPYELTASPQVVDTLGGQMHMRWDRGAAAHGQLVSFAEFLAATAVFNRWVSSCHLETRSGNAPEKRDLLAKVNLSFQGSGNHGRGARPLAGSISRRRSSGGFLCLLGVRSPSLHELPTTTDRV